MLKDTYRTISKPVSNILFKDKNSKFLGYAFQIKNEEEIKTHLEIIKKEHYNARHWCYAYQLGTKTVAYRANDDGEPSNTAGMPIYGQIQSFDLTNILVVVVRYFGGVKLGVGGLINAYKTTARLTIENSLIVTKTINEEFLLVFEYKDMNTAMRIIKENAIKILDQNLALDCKIKISVRQKEVAKVFEIFDNIYGIEIKTI